MHTNTEWRKQLLKNIQQARQAGRVQLPIYPNIKICGFLSILLLDLINRSILVVGSELIQSCVLWSKQPWVWNPGRTPDMRPLVSWVRRMKHEQKNIGDFQILFTIAVPTMWFHLKITCFCARHRQKEKWSELRQPFIDFVTGPRVKSRFTYKVKQSVFFCFLKWLNFLNWTRLQMQYVPDEYSKIDKIQVTFSLRKWKNTMKKEEIH